MRPTCETDGRTVYECVDCGDRAESPGRCECGGELWNLSQSRDL
ncbi:rubrerythrin-like domain-containing protein [Halorubrum sp. SY-15]